MARGDTRADAEPADLTDDPEALLADEDALLDALLLARRRDEQTLQPVSLPRFQIGGKPLTFRIRVLSAEEIRDCEKAATVRVPDQSVRGRAMTWREQLDNLDYQARLILSATHPPDAERLWRSQKLRDAFNVVKPLDMIKEVLNYGDIVILAAEVLKLAGIAPDEQEQAKSPD